MAASDPSCPAPEDNGVDGKGWERSCVCVRACLCLVVTCSISFPGLDTTNKGQWRFMQGVILCLFKVFMFMMCGADRKVF